MTKRRRRKFREIEVIETLLHQGVVILCFRCRQPITLEDVKVGNVNKEHLHEFELDGPDVPDNCRFSHKGKPCHHFVTYGNGATTAGSSANRIAKATHPNRTEKFVVNKPALRITEAAAAAPDDSCCCSACGLIMAPGEEHDCPKARRSNNAFPGGHRPMPGSRASGWKRPLDPRKKPERRNVRQPQ